MRNLYISPKVRKSDISSNYISLMICLRKLIFSRDTVGFLKPNINAYTFIQKHIIPQPNDTIIFFDDQLINLKVAKKFGWKTVHIHPFFNSIDQKYVNFWFKNIYKALAFFIKN